MRIPHSTILFSFFKKLDQGLCCKYYSKLICLLLLFLCINVTDLSKCSSSVPSSNAITIQQSILRDSVNTIHFKTIQGAVSKLFYHLCFYYYLGIVRITPWTVILKTDKEGSLLRFNATSNHPCYYFFQVDSTEKYIYAGFCDGFIGNWMYRLTTDSGTFVDAIDFGFNFNYIIPAENGDYYLAIWSKYQEVFTIRKSNRISLYGISVELTSGRIIVTGTNSLGGYISKFPIESIDAHRDFSQANFTIDVIPNNILEILFENSEIPLTTETRSLISSYRSFSLPSTLSYYIILYYKSDVYYQLQDQFILLIENNKYQQTLNLSCSSSGSTDISFSIVGDFGSRVPDWVSVNSTSGVLTLVTPDVDSDTDYYFSISSSITGISNPILKHIKLTIQRCIVVNCSRCSNSNHLFCEVCNSGNSLINGNCIPLESVVKSSIDHTHSIVLQTFAWLVLALNLISSWISCSSISCFWLMMNQLQFFFLLLLTRSHFPSSIVETIKGADLAINPPLMFHFQDAEGYKSLFQGIYFEQSDPTYKLLNIESESTIYNIFPLLFMIALISLINLIVNLLFWLLTKCNIQGVCPKIAGVIEFLKNIVIKFIKLNIYIRLIMIISLYILVSITNEVNNLNSSNPWRIVSLIFIIWLMIFFIAKIILVFSLSVTYRGVPNDNYEVFEEFFRGIKNERESRIFCSIHLIRKIYYVIILVIYPSIDTWPMISMIVIYQLAYFAFLAYIRPYQEIKCNIVDIINELIFLSLLVTHFFVKSEQDWKTTITNIYSAIIVTNIIIIFVIICMELVIKLTCFLKKKCQMPNGNDAEHNSRERDNEIEFQIRQHENSNQTKINNIEEICEEVKDKTEPKVEVEEIKVETKFEDKNMQNEEESNESKDELRFRHYYFKPKVVE